MFCTVVPSIPVSTRSGRPLSSSEGRVLAGFLQFLPTKRRIGVWLRTHHIVPSKQSGFRLLIADLEGDDEALSRTRHLETVLLDRMALAIQPVGGKPKTTESDIDAERLHSLLAGYNGDSLIVGHVMPTTRRIRIRMLSRYEREAGRHGPYQVGWTELPDALGLDVADQLQALTALSLSPAAQNERDRACLINLLRPAVTGLTRILDEQSTSADGERQGAVWQALGLAAALLGEHTRSQRWLEVAVHAHRTALLIWQEDAFVLQWATVQNNLGHTLRLLAEQHLDRRKQIPLLEQSIDAFQQAIRVHRADATTAAYLRQTETSLAHAETLLLKQPRAA